MDNDRAGDDFRVLVIDMATVAAHHPLAVVAVRNFADEISHATDVARLWARFQSPVKISPRHTGADQHDQTDKFSSDPRGGGLAGGVDGRACIAGASAAFARA